MKIFYFTATGNSLFVAKKIKENFENVELISIPQIINNEKLEYSDDIIGIVAPTYCCYLPKIVRDFISKVKLKANYLFAVATYGNSLGGDGNEMYLYNKFALDYGIKFNYLNSILMVDNFIDVFNIEEEIEKIPSKKIDENINKIIDDIKNKKYYIKPKTITGSLSYAICKPLIKNQDKGLSAKEYTIDENCIACGTCVKVCPTGNIKIVDGKVIFGDNCLKCYACIHACPKIAIHLKKEKSLKRFRNQDIALKEIIDSNRQL